MTKKPEQKFRWEITRLAANAKYVGTIYAPDEKTALARAITEFKVAPSLQQRLVARKVDY